MRSKLLFAALMLAAALLAATQRKPSVLCKVCHCHRELCAAVCSEENMCAMRCERECATR